MISRKSFFLLSAFLLIAGLSYTRAAGLPKPNVLIIIADDLGWADIGYHGSKIRTPTLDRLARQGIRLERHYVMPTCTPSRVALITGRYPSRYGVVSPAYGQIFDRHTVTLAQVLKDCGYYTAISGKWHMGSPPSCVPRRYGFISSYGYFHGQIDPYTHLYKNGERCWHRNDVLVDETGHATDLITNEAVRVIRETKDRPFFLYVAYSVPHYPLNEPEQWTAPYKKVFKEPSRRWYAASVTHMDSGIGRILKALEETGKRNSTLIIFTSDNGGQRSWHSTTQYGGAYADRPHVRLGDNRPLRGWKGELYEGGIRVPAFAHWPGVLKPGILNEPIHAVDWFPTICSVTGCKPPKPLPWDGVNVWPLLTGERKTLGPRVMYWKTPSAQAVRRGDWKLIRFRKRKRLELYNVTEDPYEKNELSAERPDLLKSLEALLDRIAQKDRPRVGRGR